MTALLRVEDLTVRYAGRSGLRLPGRAGTQRAAVRDVSFEVADRQTYGLVGESGSGKTTVGRAILRLVTPFAGKIFLKDEEVTTLGRGTPRRYRRSVQVVFQDPTSALNQTKTVAVLVGEPIRLHFGTRGAALRRQVVEILDHVGLAASTAERYPWELSGGQRQRIAIARALSVKPELVVCDEPVSALDVSTQSQIINLFEDLQQSTGVSYLFIAHDLAVVRHISDEVGVLYAGRLMETGPAERVYRQPAHPYTRALIAAIPVPDPVTQQENRVLRRSLRTAQEAGSEATDANAGCPFAPRCPHAIDICRTTVPLPVPVDGGGTVACHRHPVAVS